MQVEVVVSASPGAVGVDTQEPASDEHVAVIVGVGGLTADLYRHVAILRS